jgi:hypothetical protein
LLIEIVHIIFSSLEFFDCPGTIAGKATAGVEPALSPSG